jgi:hypothetical protein
MGQSSECQDEKWNFLRHRQPSRKLVALERARQLVVLVGITTFAVWALMGHWTSWTGTWWGCKNAGFDSGDRSEFRWSQVGPIDCSSSLVALVSPCADTNGSRSFPQNISCTIHASMGLTVPG